MPLPFQPKFLYRRRLATPVPSSMGADYSAGVSGFGDYFRGSLTPRTDWATPRYVRDEPSGIEASRQVLNAMGRFGGFGEAGVDCVHALNQELRNLVDDAINSIFNAIGGGSFGGSIARGTVEGATGNLTDLIMNAVGSGESAGFAALADAVQNVNRPKFKQTLIDGVAKISTNSTVLSAATAFINTNSDKLFDALRSYFERCSGTSIEEPLPAEPEFVPAPMPTKSYQDMTPAEQAAFLQSVSFQTYAAPAVVQKPLDLSTVTFKPVSTMVAKPQIKPTSVNMIVYAAIGLGALLLLTSGKKKEGAK